MPLLDPDVVHDLGGWSLPGLVELLHLQALGDDLFRGGQPGGPRPRVFGGQVAAQALAAATRTVGDDRLVHSLHAYFLRAGDPAAPIDFAVERLTDGRSFAARRVTAVQGPRVLFTMTASFAVPEAGHHHERPAPEVPDPDSLVADVDGWAAFDLGPEMLLAHPGPVEIRSVDPLSLTAREQGLRSDHYRCWLRAAGPLPDDPALHACVFTWASDLVMLDVTMRPHGLALPARDVTAVSLDHAIWFHEPLRMDDWLLFDDETPWTGAARGMSRALVHRRDGGLCAEVAQEGLVRPMA